VGHSPLLKVLLGTLLIGGGALAQQGLIVEPWRVTSPPPPAAHVPRALPASGLPGPAAVAAAAPASPPPQVEPPTPIKWSPPVVELLVDPWAKDRLAAPPAPRWSPQLNDIVDPWADQPSEPPRVARRPIGPGSAPIF
jgi:hypothetical protein